MTEHTKPAGMTLANKITVLRIIAIPFFVITLLNKQMDIARTIFIISVITDSLDGTLARMRKERTALGSFLDPLADKLLLLTTFISLTALGSIPLWVFIAVLSRDFIIVLGWSIVFILTGNKKIEPRPLGKATTALQMAFAVAVLFHLPEVSVHVLLPLMITATIASALDYVWVGNKRLGAIH
jgi:cardiolipin synthase (CMP-forming)